VGEELKPILDRIPPKWLKYVQVGKGWEPIVLELNLRLAAIDPDYEVHQVKEKFGGLRYYSSLDMHPEAAVFIREAERLAAVTCENCGAAGRQRSGGWVRTLCDACEALR